MKKLLIACIICSLFLVGVVSAEENHPVCDFIMNYTNFDGAVMPKGIPFSNEVFNAYMEDETPVGSLTVEKKVITQAGCEIQDEYTYKVTIKDLETVEKIYGAQDGVTEYNNQRDLGNIDIEATTFGGSVKIAAVNTIARVFSWFS